MIIYFHVAAALSGDELRPTFGKYIQADAASQGANPSPLVARELAFESIRQAEFPGRPSRLSSCFLFDSLEDAVPYTELTGRLGPPRLVYRVSAPHGARTFRGDLMWAVRGQEGHVALEVAARGYWSGKPFYGHGWWEVLCEPPVRILGAVPEHELSPHRGRLEEDTGQGLRDASEWD